MVGPGGIAAACVRLVSLLGLLLNAIVAAEVSGLGASEMSCRVLINPLLYCLAIATGAGSDLKPRIALDIGHSVKRLRRRQRERSGRIFFQQGDRRGAAAIPDEVR